MKVLSCSKLSKSFSGVELFNNISFDINIKDKIAIIGKNGTGKSTLLKMIIGEDGFDSGEVHINKQASIGYLSQNVIEDESNTLFDEMKIVFKDIIGVEEKLQNCSLLLEQDPHNEDNLALYERLEHDFNIRGGYDYLHKIDMFLSKFGFLKEDYNRNIATFSGGEKTRIAFSKLLLKGPDLLILDEPTNHLDIEIIEWLEGYLASFQKAILLVTHDKYFISKVCKKIIELDQNKAHFYTGSFAEYEEEKIKRYELQLKMYKKQQKQIAHLQSFVDRFRYNSKRASIAQDRVKKINRIEKINAPTKSKARISLAFEGRRPTKEIIIEGKDCAIGYESVLIDHLNFNMRGFDKLAIIGRNGTGKTTLLKTILKEIPLKSGKIEWLFEYRIGYFNQSQDGLSLHKTIFEEIHDLYPHFTNGEVRNVAARFLFTDEDVFKPISVLSGGEKVRLVLLLLMLEQPDLLILDEPTNHLDIETKDIVEDVFDQFMGPIIFVSHDRYFIDKISTKVIYFGDKVTVFDGNYSEFKELNKEKQVVKKIKKAKFKKVNYQKEIDKVELRIHEIEDELANLKELSFTSEYYLDKVKMNKLEQDILTLNTELEELFKTYEQLHDLLDQEVA